MARCDEPDAEGVPSYVMLQSMLDITSGLLLCGRYTSGWAVLVEDDNTLCEGALNELVTTLGGRKVAFAKFSPSWTGMSFPVCKGRAYADYSASRLKTHPHDVTQRVEDWDNPDKGEMYTHARSLFKHIGRVSTQEYRNSEEFRALYAEMRDCECEQVIRV